MSSRLQRFHQAVFILSTVMLSWLGMMAVHELGHVLGAWCSGGVVSRVVLHPLSISRTELSYNPHPFIVAWAGPLLGVAFPLLLWAIAAAVKLPGAWWLRFFAGFCLIANGVYLGAGTFDRVGDVLDLLRHGSVMWHLWLFGLCSFAAGLALWNGLGQHFGLALSKTSTQKNTISAAAAYTCFAVLLIVAACQIIFFGGH